MNRRLLAPVALVAGGLLLAACGQTPDDQGSAADGAGETSAATSESTAGTEDTSIATDDETADDSIATEDETSGDANTLATDDLEPVDCGEIELHTGEVHRLIALPAAAGLVGCTEAFNVTGEFLELSPEEQAEASLGNVELSDGWSCTVDDGETAALGCVKGRDGDDFEFAFQTEA
ncbi:hypothetical protein [Actinoalloteichus hymeniacidonis]|uniref:Uncharacterized protein n=1 Tax=Actinoalloteichus hymeniacidonis TaxID=340345 RepID=A0AAC9HSD0_9PSEU|nr:hypothetical protein [Actinoalloteichus hymeniacidonis]AOS64101.1 hypothetical protein TL08_16505 [Actinoalloteichus hymeniacidonis]MBB5907835.1 hypothetical protein [Actinoalloteichus hymeniacidonis]